jgi:hypothetical protein
MHLASRSAKPANPAPGRLHGHTDSDFGNGGTDARGHTIKAAYALKDNWTVGGTLFVNEIDLASGTPRDYTRLQLDLVFSF